MKKLFIFFLSFTKIVKNQKDVKFISLGFKGDHNNSEASFSCVVQLLFIVLNPLSGLKDKRF